MGEALTCEERGCGETGNTHVEGCPLRVCKGKAAARALAVMVLSPEISFYLLQNDRKALDQAREALRPFGYPSEQALREKFGL